MKLNNLQESIIKPPPFKHKIEDKIGIISGIELNDYFKTEGDDIDFYIEEASKNELIIKLIYEHKKTGQLIEIEWRTMDYSEIAQERRYKRYTHKRENSIFRRMQLKHNMPHDDKYNSYKYEIVSEDNNE